MIRLTYASTALKEWSSEELLKLLKECRTNNGANNITGILLYANGTFFQVLEGDEATVNNLYAMIENDKRHKDVTIIQKEKISERANHRTSFLCDATVYHMKNACKTVDR